MTRARIADILTHACRLSGLNRGVVLGTSRKKHIVRVRHAVALIAREQTIDHDGNAEPAYSFPTIARTLRRFDHSTIIHACDRARALVDHDPAFAAFVAELRDAASRGEPFVGWNSEPIAVVAAKPKPVKRPHIKAIVLRTGEEPDDGHKFHAGIARGSEALAAAMRKAMAA